ncbi:MAG TPA: M20 family metallopeptidase [Acidimicrobiales bacterium]|nr:M20 family metallopeptidase [Acidimicrobiales bacterium]
MTATLLSEAQALGPLAVDLRRRIHAHPELGLDLPRTQEVIVDALAGLPLRVTTGSACTSVIAVLEGERPGPTVLLRGDMDALPLPEQNGLPFASEIDGAMHACGHDAHVAMLVGAAQLLVDHRVELSGRVLFMFQPGEEGHAGARVMLREGLLDGPDAPVAAFALHTTPTMRAGLVGCRGGALMAATNTLRIRVVGRGGHASMPHDAVDPIPVAAEIVTALQNFVTRRVNAFDPAVVTIAKFTAGTAVNVIPEDAVLEGTIRTFSEKTRADVVDGVARLAEGIAGAHGCTAEVALDPGYPVTVNDDTMADYLLSSAASVLGDDATRVMPSPVMGAEDFSFVLHKVPGAMAFLGTRPDRVDGPIAPNHSNKMLLNEDALAAGIAVHARAALGLAAALDAPS